MPGPRPCHCRPFIFCIVGRGLDPSAGRRGRHPLQCSARLLLVAKGHGGLGAGRPTSHFSTVRRAGCPHPAAASPLPPVFGLFCTKKQGFARSRSPAARLTAYCNALISPPAAPPARPFPRRCGSPPRRKFRRRGLPAHRGRSPRRGGRAAGAAPCSPALPAPCGRRPA